MSKIFLVGLCFLCTGFVNVFAGSETPDSLLTHVLDGVHVNGQWLKTTRTSLPVQAFSEKEIESLNSTTLSDVAKYFAGVTVKDYGGIGGLKTVSLRGLGALHTGVSLDGVMMSDVQTGEIDLGRFSVENISEVSLSNGQPNDLFQSARMFASSGVLSFTTKMPDYDGHHTVSGKITAKVGSFGLINPVVYVCKNFNPKLAVSISADGLTADGKYTYLSNLNNQGVNLVEKTRINSDVQSLRSEINLIYRLNALENLSVKANGYFSDRGLPGPDIFYSTFSTERLLDKNGFAQVHYENKQSAYFQYRVLAKYNSSYLRFTDVDPKYNLLIDQKLREEYRQNEYYISTTLQYHPTDNFYLSNSYDWFYNNLFSHSNIGYGQDAAPTRNTGLANIAAKYMTDRLTASANLLYTLTSETTQTGVSAPNREKLSPTASLSYQLVENKELRLRAFYKNIFRLPTFSDLYYHDLGYVNLLPEVTNQYNLGLVYRELEIPGIAELELSVDAYYNLVKDKITIIYGMPYSSIRNIGTVNIHGTDATLKFTVPINTHSMIYFRANYTWQLAQNATAGSVNYGEQIPYTPVNSGSASVSYRFNKFECGCNVLYSGKRWDGQNIDDNLLAPYLEPSIYSKITIHAFRLMGEIINLTDSRYQVIKNYPMPGRNYRITVSMNI